jgi:hypothetical protein
VIRGIFPDAQLLSPDEKAFLMDENDFAAVRVQ